MKKSYAGLIASLFFIGFSYNTGILFAAHDHSVKLESIQSTLSMQNRAYIFDDALLNNEHPTGYTEIPDCDALEIQESTDGTYDYMAESPYYKIFFKGRTTRISSQNANLTLALKGEEGAGESQLYTYIDTHTLIVSDALPSTDLSFSLSSDTVREHVLLKEPVPYDRIVYAITWQGITPQIQEDGSIVFANEKKVFKILPPFMKDASGSVCTDLHYELVKTDILSASGSESGSGIELHKIIDKEGITWLQTAQYPVVVDPSIETFEDAWESSGLHPYGQYFKNITEYVNPATGHLTMTQTDLTIPGRGLDVVISRVYETPAVFYGTSPYDYESPPVSVGKGWSLNFPYVGTKYLHLWGGTTYKIEWTGSTFVNHTGTHFVLEKNGDTTFTLTTANGTVYDFSTSGNITSITDIDGNTITFSYTSGLLSSITDTIGRTLTFTYNASNHLTKIGYNNAEIEYGYANGCLMWMDDFLDRRTTYTYNTGYNDWLVSKIEYPTGGYTTYTYNRFSDSNYYKYHVTDQRVYETAQVTHSVIAYSGNFQSITGSCITVKNGSDITKGSYEQTISDGVITEKTVKNASGTPIKKFSYTYNSKNELIQQSVYNDGTHLSYTTYYAYDNWGNCIYRKNAEGHEQFFSYAHTSTSGYFVDDNNTVIKQFTNAFASHAIPSSVHTALLGTAEKQDSTYVREVYMTYDAQAHATQSKNLFGNSTTWMTFSGTFNEQTGETSFPVDLTGHTVTGNAVLQVSGLASDSTYQEIHTDTHSSSTCRPDIIKSTWTCNGWNNNYFSVNWNVCCGQFPDVNCDSGSLSIGPFVHYPGTLGYQSYSTSPSCGGQWWDFTVTTNWKAYPVQVQYKFDATNWTTLTSNLKNSTVSAPAVITGGSHTLYFSESSAKHTKCSWNLWVPVDNSSDTYTTSRTYDTYGNITSITDAQSNTVSLSYSSTYSSAYLTEISITEGSDTLTTKTTYDGTRGWITSLQHPKGVDAGSGYDYLYTYDLLGRITKIEFPLLSGQSQRSYMEAVYNDTANTLTLIDQLRHFIVKQYDALGRVTNMKWYTGTYGSGTLYATESYTYGYDSLLASVTDPGNHQTTYTYDFLGRLTNSTYPDSSSNFYTYDDQNNTVTYTSPRGFDTIYWYDWLSQLTKVEEEYLSDSFGTTTYQYDDIGNLISLTDAESHTTTYTYGSLFGPTRITYADSTYEDYQYNNTGYTTSITDAHGNETTLTYDVLYRLTQIQYEDLSTVNYSYDFNNNMIRMEDDAPGTGDYCSYSYDTWNRLINTTRYISTDSYSVSYQYDTGNRLTKLTYPNGMQILHSYDDLNRITEITRYIDGSNDEILMDNVQYSVENLLSQLDYGNGLRSTFTYDSRDILSTLDVKDGETYLLDLEYTVDYTGNITQLVNGWRDTNSIWHSETESYSYDGLDRLTSATCSSWSHTYSYDKAGNRTGKDGITYTIDSVNQVTALSDGTSFTYDSNGNRTQKTKGTDTWEYTYDYANRLTSVEKNSQSVGSYVYDGKGNRLQVTENSTTITYIYDGDNVLYEKTATGIAAYIYGPMGRLAKRTTINEQSTTYFFHTDHLGSTRLVTDATNTIIAAVTYHPFGTPCTEEGSENYVFNGKEQDETELLYYGARYYDSSIGRFLTRDPLNGRLKTPQSLNRYTYCVNNPVKYIDPWGEIYHPNEPCIDGGGDVEEPEITGDPEWKGDGEVTIPTSEGDVTIDSKDGENIGDWDEKAIEQREKETLDEYTEKSKNLMDKIKKALAKRAAQISDKNTEDKCATKWECIYDTEYGCYHCAKRECKKEDGQWECGPIVGHQECVNGAPPGLVFFVPGLNHLESWDFKPCPCIAAPE